jgi:hypothetical protein
MLRAKRFPRASLARALPHHARLGPAASLLEDTPHDLVTQVSAALTPAGCSAGASSTATLRHEPLEESAALATARSATWTEATTTAEPATALTEPATATATQATAGAALLHHLHQASHTLVRRRRRAFLLLHFLRLSRRLGGHLFAAPRQLFHLGSPLALVSLWHFTLSRLSLQPAPSH